MEMRRQKIFLAAAFLVVVYGVGLTQAGIEIVQGGRPQFLDLFTEGPSERNLRAFESELEDTSWFSQVSQPGMRYLQFAVLRDAGDKALMGHNGWFFFKPGVQYLIESLPVSGEPASHGGDSVSAIVAYRDRLAARGITLLVVPIPGKASVYPDRLTGRATSGGGAINTHTQDVLANLREAGVEFVDLTAAYLRARASGPDSEGSALYLSQDTHWTPEGMRLAARTVAEKVRELGCISEATVRYDVRPLPLETPGDILRMMNIPTINRRAVPNELECIQVFHEGNEDLYNDVTDSEVLVLGDSFLRIYEWDESGRNRLSAGFIAHLAKELETPLTSIVSDGGASTLVRQELSRKAGLLANKKLVIWEFVERDIRFGTEGWRDVPLPAIAADESG